MKFSIITNSRTIKLETLSRIAIVEIFRLFVFCYIGVLLSKLLSQLIILSEYSFDPISWKQQIIEVEGAEAGRLTLPGTWADLTGVVITFVLVPLLIMLPFYRKCQYLFFYPLIFCCFVFCNFYFHWSIYVDRPANFLVNVFKIQTPER